MPAQFGELNPVHVRHTDIAQNNVTRVVFQELQCRGPRRHVTDHGEILEALHDLYERFAEELLVIDDQNLNFPNHAPYT